MKSRYWICWPVALLVIALNNQSLAWDISPVQIRTEGDLVVDLVNETFTLTSTSFTSNPETGLTDELAIGMATFEPDRVLTSGDLFWSGPTGTVTGTFEGYIPIKDNGEFGIGFGVFSVNSGTGDFVDWTGCEIPFNSRCGIDQFGFGRSYNLYGIPEPCSVVGYAVLALILSSRFRQRQT